MTARVSQGATLVLDAGTANTRVSQQAVLVLAQNTTPIRVSQEAILVLGREIKRRVLSVADTRS